MIAVAAMHEDVHQRTGKQEEKGKRSQKMGPVLADQQETRDRDEAQENDRSSRRPEIWRGCVVAPVLRMIVHGHGVGLSLALVGIRFARHASDFDPLIASGMRNGATELL